MSFALSVLAGVLFTALILVTLPWWGTLVGPLVDRWLDWTIRRADQIEERRRTKRGGGSWTT